MSQSIEKLPPKAGIDSLGFASEGIFLPVPLGYTGVNRPIPPDSSYLKRLMVVPGRRRERLFGITGGERSHCFMALPKPPYGYVIDMGAAPEGVELRNLTPFVRTLPSGYRAMGLILAGIAGEDTILYAQGRPHAYHGLQEWKVFIPPRRELCRLPGLEGHTCLLHPREDNHQFLVAGPKRWAVVALAEDETNTIQQGENPKSDLLPVVRTGAEGNLWVDRGGQVLNWDWEKLAFSVCGEAPPRAKGTWQWARTDGIHGLWLSDGSNHIYGWTPQGGLLSMGMAPYAPIHFMIRAADGRCFGFCGDGIGHWFEWIEKTGSVRSLGPIASFLVHPRYGFQFADAAAGNDGALYLAENDRGGHLWIHYPGTGSSSS